MGEIFKPVTQWISTNVGWSVLLGLFILSLFFEFSKIKLSPITALFKWIGDRLTAGLKVEISELRENTDKRFDEMKAETDQNLKELKDSVNASMAELTAKSNLNDSEFQRKLDDIEEKQDLQICSRVKAHVLNFSRQCRNGEKHSLEDFKNLFQENLEYSRLVEKHGWINDVYKHDFAFIERVYDECNANNDFLGG